MSFTFGQEVTFTWHLARHSDYEEGGRWIKRWAVRSYPGQPAPRSRKGVVIGVRTLSNGRVTYGYEGPAEYRATERFRAYLVAFDMHRQPVLVLPEHIEAAS